MPLTHCVAIPLVFGFLEGMPSRDGRREAQVRLSGLRRSISNKTQPLYRHSQAYQGPVVSHVIVWLYVQPMKTSTVVLSNERRGQQDAMCDLGQGKPRRGIKNYRQGGHRGQLPSRKSAWNAARVGRQLQPIRVVGNTDDKQDQEDWDSGMSERARQSSTSLWVTPPPDFHPLCRYGAWPVFSSRRSVTVTLCLRIGGLLLHSLAFMQVPSSNPTSSRLRDGCLFHADRWSGMETN